jgi:hypothetical protein
LAGDERKLHVEERCVLYSTLNIIWVIKTRRIRWMGHVACISQRRKAHRAVLGKPEGEKLLRGSRYRWEDNVKMDFKETGWEDVDWIDLAQDRETQWAVVDMVTNLWIP